MKGIRIEGLRKSFPGRRLFTSFSLELPSRGFYALFGASGSGKTTVLDCLSGLEKADGGEIFLFGRAVKGGYPDRLLDIGYLRQGYDLLLEERAVDNVALPLLAAGTRKGVAERKARETLKRLGLSSHLHDKAKTLSGGERARLALARALVLDPPLLLCDEPTGALDGENALLVYRLLAVEGKRRLVFMVSHDEERTIPFLSGAYRLRDGKAEQLFEQGAETSRGGNPRRRKRKDGFCLFLEMAFRRLGFRKVETGFFLLVLSFAFSSLGIGNYVSNSLPMALEESFTAITGKGELHVESRDGVLSISETSPTDEEMGELGSVLGDEAVAYGASYLAPWESLFPEANEGSIVYRNRACPLDGLTIRSVNDVLLLDEAVGELIYPNRPEVMEVDQVILGLPFEELNAVCRDYGIGRDYESFGRFLEQNPVELIFSFVNSSWGYDAEVLLEVIGVMESEKVGLIHSSMGWNQEMLEGALSLPAYLEEGESGEPWAILKRPYVLPREDPTSFIAKWREDPRFEGYLFERANRELNRAHFGEGPVSRLNRVYITSLDELPFDVCSFREIASREEIEGVAYLASGSYLSYPEALASGFAAPFYLSTDEKLLFSVVEALPSYGIEGGRPLPEETDGVDIGYFLFPRTESLVISNGGSLIEGKKPSSIHEIGLSKSLYEELGRPERIEVAAYRESEFVGLDQLKDAYSYLSLEVSGIYEGEGDVLHVPPYWSIDFFRDAVGMDASELLVSEAILVLGEGIDGPSFASFLNSRYPSFRFVDPSSLLEEGIDEAVSYMGAVLSALVAFSVAMAFFMAIGVGLGGSEASQKEGRALFVLGFNREEVSSREFLSMALPLVLSLVFSLAGLLILEWSAHEALAEAFGASTFELDARPLVLVAILALFILFVLGIISFFKGKGRDFSRNGS